ncbi:MAG: T9SS type A sorting domain-containing protein [Bacteroidales bacterium]
MKTLKIFPLLIAGILACSVCGVLSKVDAQTQLPVQNQKEIIVSEEKKGADSSKDLIYDPANPMFGLNSYVPAHDTTWKTDMDWYGSGDFNGDGEITWEDYDYSVSGDDPFYDGTHRADTDLDGVSGTASDRQIVYEYLTGERTHINRWELESVAEKQSHLEKALAIDFTSEVPPSSGWNCGGYMTQTFINFAGIYDIENSSYAEPNGTNLDFDIEHNGIWRIPMRNVNTYTTSNVNHFLNGVFMGSPENQDATEFNSWTFVEPQTDEIVVPGDFSIHPDKFANISWVGYYYNEYFYQWLYGSRTLLNYDLDEGNPTLQLENPDIIYSWNPFEEVEYPQDKNHEYPADTSLATNGAPDNVYPGTKYSYNDVSSQTSNGTCTDVTYEVNRSFEGIAGAYNKGNTANAEHTQNIHVQDNIPPQYTSFPSDTTITINDPMDPEHLGYPQWSDNSQLFVTPHYFDVLLTATDDPIQHWERHWTGVDVCDNISADSVQHIYVDLLEHLAEKENPFTVYPNPAGRHVTVAGNTAQQAQQVSLFDVMGNLVSERNLHGATGVLKLDLQGLPNGIYLLKIHSAGLSPVVRVVKID